MTENLIIMNIGDSDILYSFDRARLIDRARNGFMRIDGLTFKLEIIWTNIVLVII